MNYIMYRQDWQELLFYQPTYDIMMPINANVWI